MSLTYMYYPYGPISDNEKRDQSLCAQAGAYIRATVPLSKYSFPWVSVAGTSCGLYLNPDFSVTFGKSGGLSRSSVRQQRSRFITIGFVDKLSLFLVI